MNDWSRPHSQSGRSSSSKGSPTLMMQQLGWNTLEVCMKSSQSCDDVQNSQWTDRNTGITVSDSKHSEYDRTRLKVPCSSWVCRCLQLQFLPYYYSDLEPIAGCYRHVPFHRGLQVSIAGHPGDSDVNLDTFVLFLSYTPARFYLSVELGFIVCFLHFMHICHMHDITQL